MSYPHLQFDSSVTEFDDSWKPDVRESISNVMNRIERFFQWLSHRSEKVVAIVSHGVWIECCLYKYYPSALDGGRRVYNCDVCECDFVTEVRDGVKSSRLSRAQIILSDFM